MGERLGLFTSSTATAFCHSIPLSTTLWDQTAMRKHLLQCFKNENMVPFLAWVCLPGMCLSLPPLLKSRLSLQSVWKCAVSLGCHVIGDRRWPNVHCVGCGNTRHAKTFQTWFSVIITSSLILLMNSLLCVYMYSHCYYYQELYTAVTTASLHTHLQIAWWEVCTF